MFDPPILPNVREIISVDGTICYHYQLGDGGLHVTANIIPDHAVIVETVDERNGDAKGISG